jgi:hypothetical protein
VVWTGLTWLRAGTGGGRALVNTEMNLRVPYNAVKFFSGCTTGRLSGRTRLHAVSCETAGKISLYGILRSLCDSGMEDINHLLILIRS